MSSLKQLFRGLRRGYRTLSLEVQIRVILLLLALGATYLIGYLAYTHSRQSLLQATYDQLAISSQLKDDDLKNWLGGNRRVLEALASRPLVETYTAVLHTSTLESASVYQEAYHALQEAHFLPSLRPHSFRQLSLTEAPSGDVLLSTAPELEGKNQGRESFFATGQEETYIVFPQYDDTEDGQTMHLVTPVRNEQGALIAVLSGRLDMTDLSRLLLQGNDLTETQESYLVNRNRLFLTEGRFAEGLAGQQTVESLGMSRCLAGRNGVAQYVDYRNKEVLGAYRWVEELDACLLTEIDHDEAFMPITQLQQYLALMGAAVTAGVLLLGGLFARGIILPLRRLHEGVHAVSAGDLDHRIPVNTGDEIGELAAAFNQMIARRQETEAKLHAHRDHLSEMVTARTAQLEQTNAELEQANRELARHMAERAKAEAERKRQWRQFLIIIEQNADGILIVDEAGVVQFVNPATERLLGRPAAELIDKPSPLVVAKVAGAVELRLSTPEGATHILEMRVVSTTWDEKPAYLASLRDISERRRAEKRIRYQARLLETVSDAIISVEGKEDRIRSWNKAAEALYGWQAVEVIGRPLQEILPPTFVNDTREEVEAYLEELGRWRGEVIQQCRDGTDLYLMASVAIITDPDEGESGAVITTHDITAQKQLQKELNAYSERLEEMVRKRTVALQEAQADLVRQEKLAILGQLAGGVAHELRNPLGAIKNTAYLLDMMLPDPDPDMAEAIEILQREVDACNRIINSLLDYARPREPVPSRTSLQRLLDQALAVQPTTPPSVDVSLHLPQDECPLLVDEAQMTIALSNIITNGIQAISQTEEEETAVGALTIWCQSGDAAEAQLTISDTGPGIPPAQQEKMFEPLYTTKAKGIGLGLALAKMLIEKNNGRIEVESSVGAGTTFVIFLPRPPATN